jgi:hypothetical protein
MLKGISMLFWLGLSMLAYACGFYGLQIWLGLRQFRAAGLTEREVHRILEQCEAQTRAELQRRRAA